MPKKPAQTVTTVQSSSLEKDRLDLRSHLETLMDERLANVMMEAIPPIDYKKLATKDDVRDVRRGLAAAQSELRGEMAELRGELHELTGKTRADVAQNLRLVVFAILGVGIALGSLITALR